MTPRALVRLFVSLLLLSQLASVHALAASPSMAASPSSHCAAHAGGSAPAAPAGMAADGDCCLQLAGCHCPQAPASGPALAVLGESFSHDVPVLASRAPPPQLVVDEHLRPPI
jgi:hypothetical protein